MFLQWAVKALWQSDLGKCGQMISPAFELESEEIAAETTMLDGSAFSVSSSFSSNLSMLNTSFDETSEKQLEAAF